VADTLAADTGAGMAIDERSARRRVERSDAGIKD
jgi:hypothetical protein